MNYDGSPKGVRDVFSSPTPVSATSVMELFPNFPMPPESAPIWLRTPQSRQSHQFARSHDAPANAKPRWIVVANRSDATKKAIPPAPAAVLTPMQVIGKGNSSRWILDAFDRAALEHAFRLDPFPNAASRQQLGLELNVSPRQIQVWFQNRRQREKLQNAGRLPTMQRVESPPQDAESFTGLKQKRDILHMLKDMRPGALQMQMQMQQHLTHAQSQQPTQATTFRVLSADSHPPAGVQPPMPSSPRSEETSPPASPPADQQSELAPEPKRAKHAESISGPWILPSDPWVKPDDGLTLLSIGAPSPLPGHPLPRHTCECVLDHEPPHLPPPPPGHGPPASIASCSSPLAPCLHSCHLLLRPT